MCLTVWWRTIELTNATGVDDKLGTYLEETFLDKLDPPYGKAEWHALKGRTPPLEKLCKDLDEITKNQKNEWWISVFDHKTDITTFPKGRFPQ